MVTLNDAYTKLGALSEERAKRVFELIEDLTELEARGECRGPGDCTRCIGGWRATRAVGASEVETGCHTRYPLSPARKNFFWGFVMSAFTGACVAQSMDSQKIHDRPGA